MGIQGRGNSDHYLLRAALATRPFEEIVLFFRQSDLRRNFMLKLTLKGSGETLVYSSMELRVKLRKYIVAVFEVLVVYFYEYFVVLVYQLSFK